MYELSSTLFTLKKHSNSKLHFIQMRTVEYIDPIKAISSDRVIGDFVTGYQSFGFGVVCFLCAY